MVIHLTKRNTTLNYIFSYYKQKIGFYPNESGYIIGPIYNILYGDDLSNPRLYYKVNIIEYAKLLNVTLIYYTSYMIVHYIVLTSKNHVDLFLERI